MIAADRRARALLLTVVAVACAPYVVLKLLWVAGASPGVRDTALIHSALYRAANVITLVLDLVLVLVVVVLSGPRSTGRLGRLLALPATIGLGLLLPVVTAAPVIAVVGALDPGPEAAADEGLAPWVYAVVYTGFTVQFGCLAVATAIHVRRRPTPYRPVGPGATGLVAATGAAYVLGLAAWAGGATVGLTAGVDLPRSSRILYAVLAGLTVVAVALMTRARRDPAVRFLALVGAMAVWTWALFSLLTTLATPEGPPTVGSLGVAVWLCGAACGLTAALQWWPALARQVGRA